MFVKVIASPPPGMSLPWMGPLLFTNSPKRRKQEKTNREFTDKVLEAVNADKQTTLIRLICTPEYFDARPYEWEGLTVNPRYTYRLDLNDRTVDEVLMSFSSDVRSEIREGSDLDIQLNVKGPDAAGKIYDEYNKRIEELGSTLPTSREFTCEFMEALGDRARAYVAETPDGEFVGGITVLYSNDTAFSWQGGMRANYEGVSVNSLLDWRIIEDILTEPSLDSIDWYDFGNANDERLSWYKAKYNPQLVPHYEVLSGQAISVIKTVYNKVVI